MLSSLITLNNTRYVNKMFGVNEALRCGFNKGVYLRNVFYSASGLQQRNGKMVYG